MHYTTDTVGPYFEAMAATPISIATVWQSGAISDFPCDLATLYRWFKRLVFRLALLLTLLEKELLDLAPQTSLEALEKLIIKNAAIRRRALSASSPVDTTHTRLSVVKLHALCKSNLWLAKQLLRTVGKLLHTPQDKKLPPLLLFLNFFCWQKTGQALLSPLPQKPNPPP
jgi:hypothetical protein